MVQCIELQLATKKIKRRNFPTPLYQYLDIFSFFWLRKRKMLSAWRKAKISDHFLKPVFLFPVNDENWLTETHSNRRLSLNPFFQWSCHVHRVGIFPSKMRKTILFLFSRVHYLWTQYHCRQSSINYARNFHGSLILFIYLFIIFFYRKNGNCFQGEEHAKPMINSSLSIVSCSSYI